MMNDDTRDHIAWCGAQKIIAFLALHGFYTLDETPNLIRFSERTILQLDWSRATGLYWLTFVADGDEINWTVLRDELANQPKFEDFSRWYSYDNRFMTLAVCLSTRELLSGHRIGTSPNY